jgi:threonine/homoserine/homoserine lactone efflux protein
MLAYLLQGLSIGLTAAATPGPSQAFLIGRSLSDGWRRTLPGVLAPLVTDPPIIALMVLLLTSLPAGVLRAIQGVGGAYLLYLAAKTAQAWRDYRPAAPGAVSRTFWQAVGMNFLSPGPYLFWSMVCGPILVRGWRESPVHGAAFLLGFYAAMFAGMAALIILFGAARQLGPRVNRALIGVSALVLAGFGLYQVWQGLVG